LVVVVAYVFLLSPFVSFARTALGRTAAQDVSEVAAAAESYGAEGQETLAELLPGVQGWWARLAYPNAQSFAMKQYDQGRPGWTFGMAGYAFVPRLLYEDKPILTPGKEFTYLVKGTDTYFTGPGLIAEAYWNGGWVLAVATAMFVGGLFAVLGRISVRAIHSERWLYVPLIFTTIFLGLRPDNWFVPLYVGGVVQVVVIVWILDLTSPFVRRRIKRPANHRGTRAHMAPRVSPADAQG
jgi:hypothetical protein